MFIGLALIALVAVIALVLVFRMPTTKPDAHTALIAHHTQPRARMAAPIDPREQLIAEFAKLQKRR